MSTHSYVLARLVQAIPQLFVLVTLLFFLLILAPGDPVKLMLGQNLYQKSYDTVRHQLGLDRPLIAQYVSFLGDAVTGNWGKSWSTTRPIADIIRSTFLKTLQLSIGALVLSMLVGIPVGVLSAVTRGSLFDLILRVVAISGVSVPIFWVGIVLIYFFSYQLRIFPTSGAASFKSYVLPVVTLSVFSFALFARLTRTTVLEVLQQDFVRTARSKGLNEMAVVCKHVLRTCLTPIITVAGLQFGTLMGGAVLVETIFAWPGVGQRLITAVLSRDYPVVRYSVLIIGAAFILTNLAVDVVVSYMDPRVKY